MTITIQIKTDNAAFDGNNCVHEVARILREISDIVESNGIYYDRVQQIRDINGNVIGSLSTKEV